MAEFHGRSFSGVYIDEAPRVESRLHRTWPKQKWDVGDFVFTKETGFSFVARVDKTQDYGGGKHIEYLVVNARTGKWRLLGQTDVRPSGRRQPSDIEQAEFMKWMLTGECGDGSGTGGA